MSAAESAPIVVDVGILRGEIAALENTLTEKRALLRELEATGPEWMRVGEVARRLGISERTVKRHAADIGALAMFGGMLFADWRSIQRAFEDSRRS